MNGIHSSTGDPISDMDGREALVESSMAELFAAYDRSVEEGITNPVVFLVDCEDNIGGPIARAWEGDDTVEAAVLANADREPDNDAVVTTTLTRIFSFEDSRQEVPALFPYLAASFEQAPPRDGLLVVAIAFGGAATFTVPFDARPA